jgi:hypothetical protein
MATPPLVCEARLLAWVVHATDPRTPQRIRTQMAAFSAQGFRGVCPPSKLKLMLQPSSTTCVPGWPAAWPCEVLELHMPENSALLAREWVTAAQKALQKAQRRQDPHAALLTVYQPRFPHNGAALLSLPKVLSPYPKFFWSEDDELLAQDMGGTLTVGQWKKLWRAPPASDLLIQAVQRSPSLNDGLDQVRALARRLALASLVAPVETLSAEPAAPSHALRL